MHIDIAVVGGGMVGCSAALKLADLGLKVVVLERSEPQLVSVDDEMGLRVSALNLASQNLLVSVGAWAGINAVRHCVYRRLAVWEKETTQVVFDAAEIEQSHLGHIVENDVVQYSLWQRCLEHPNVECRIIQTLESLEQTQNSATLLVDGVPVEAGLILACDGGQSRLRQLAGIGVEGWQYQQQALVVAIETHQPSQDITWQQMTPTGPRAFLPLAQGKASLVWYHHADEVKRLKQLPVAHLKSAIKGAFPNELGEFDIDCVASFPLTRQHAQRYGKGRVVLVGDSAHLINPLAGQGVNLGFKDVVALHRCISKALEQQDDWSSSSVLQRYQSARRLDNGVMMTAMDALYVGFSNRNPLLAWARQKGLEAVHQVPLARKLATQYACGI
ncbi:FAD-dependent oxidoreductase [Echinimonas agarilytica]|uniref:FAD-dependent oxidoreductase n=1 Tax=Echinimonas agarilytica TaxID=1215918 RepID=A0AA41W562_9GAMM|nr:FAD-dependent oxidoreductase [Echinimonas agarilytica]MCM2679096.1 FAD-dependent oxidoreductase [Echinimonas agarilytica]